jgi:long-chain acyl-CoA synthetase
MKGYYRNPDATAQTVIDGWLKTGDLGSIDEDGFLYVSGREKALLISPDGEKYSPEEIEEAISNLAPIISQCLLYCDHKKYTTALISLDPETISYIKERQKIETPEELLEIIEKQFHQYLSEKTYQGRFPKAWTPKTFQILTEPFSEANKMINSTMKMVRHRIHEVHADLLEYMYTDEGDHPKNNKNIEALKTITFK